MAKRFDEEEDMGSIIDYFNKTMKDYRLIWHAGKHLSMHFGYSESEAYSHDEAILRMVKEVATRARITKDDHVIDLGCGIGGSTIWLAKNIGCMVSGVDMNPQSLAVALKEADKRGVGDLVLFRRADYRQLPFPPDCIDVAWFLESFCYAVDKYSVLREVVRVLKPGGRLVIADGLRVQAGPELETWLGGWAIPDLPTRDQFRGWLERLGYAKINIEDVTPRMLASLERLSRRSMALLPFGKVLEKVRVRTPVETANIEAAVAIYPSIKKGQWFYHITTAEKAGWA